MPKAAPPLIPPIAGPRKITLHNQVRALRLTHLIGTQAELSKKTGVPHYLISRWERGLYQPAAEHAAILARFFNVTLDEIYGLTPLLPFQGVKERKEP